MLDYKTRRLRCRSLQCPKKLRKYPQDQVPLGQVYMVARDLRHPATCQYNSSPSHDLKAQKQPLQPLLGQKANCLPQTHHLMAMPISAKLTPIPRGQGYLHGRKWKNPPISPHNRHSPLACLGINRTMLQRRKACTMGVDTGTTTITTMTGRRRPDSALHNPTCFRCNEAPEEVIVIFSNIRWIYYIPILRICDFGFHTYPSLVFITCIGQDRQIGCAVVGERKWAA